MQIVLIISQNDSGGICLRKTGNMSPHGPSSDLICLKTACCTSKNFCTKNLRIVFSLQDIIHSELKIGLESGIVEETL